jgi:hypothetical protein
MACTHSSVQDDAVAAFQKVWRPNGSYGDMELDDFLQDLMPIGGRSRRWDKRGAGGVDVAGESDEASDGYARARLRLAVEWEGLSRRDVLLVLYVPPYVHMVDPRNAYPTFLRLAWWYMSSPLSMASPKAGPCIPAAFAVAPAPWRPVPGDGALWAAQELYQRTLHFLMARAAGVAPRKCPLPWLGVSPTYRAPVPQHINTAFGGWYSQADVDEDDVLDEPCCSALLSHFASMALALVGEDKEVAGDIAHGTARMWIHNADVICDVS